MRRRFFADSLQPGRALIRGAGAIHLTRVLRAEPGQQYELVVEGRLYLARIIRAAPQVVEWELQEELFVPAPAPPLILAAALFKFDRFEWMLEKATELGASGILPLVLRRTEVHLAKAAPRRLERWRTIVKEAAQQSRRLDWPVIEPARSLADLLASPLSGRRLLLSEPPAGAPFPPSSGPMVLLTGPEGGFAPDEMQAAIAADFCAVSLGPRVLRSETAILAALALATASPGQGSGSSVHGRGRSEGASGR